jgi:hypothetical protein
LSENINPFLAPQPAKKTEDQRLEKVFELLTGRSNQAISDGCHHSGNTTAAILRTCSESVRCAIQNEIAGTFLNAIGGFCGHFYHTHLLPINPPQANFPSGPSKMYPQNTNHPPTQFLLLLSRLKTLSVRTKIHFRLKVFRGRY